MKLWLDAQLPPAIALWIAGKYSVDCEHVRGTDLAQADDAMIFTRLREPGAIIVTKDEDLSIS